MKNIKNQKQADLNKFIKAHLLGKEIEESWRMNNNGNIGAPILLPNTKIKIKFKKKK